MENAGRRSTQRAKNSELRLSKQRLWLRLEPWLPLLITLFVLGLWEFLARSGRISALFFPPPTKIFRSLFELTASGELFVHLGATLRRLILGFIVGSIPGLLLGVMMGWSIRVRAVVDPIVAAIHPIPKIAIFPLIMVIFGIGDTSKTITIAIVSFFPMLINSMAGVRQLNPVYFEVTRNYGASPWKTFARVVFPGSLPLILSGARIAFNMAMVVTITVELLTAKNGLGVIIWFAWHTLRVGDLYASLIVTGLIGVSVNLLLHLMSNKLVPWYNQKTEKPVS